MRTGAEQGQRGRLRDRFLRVGDDDLAVAALAADVAAAARETSVGRAAPATADVAARRCRLPREKRVGTNNGAKSFCPVFRPGGLGIIR